MGFNYRSIAQDLRIPHRKLVHQLFPSQTLNSFQEKMAWTLQCNPSKPARFQPSLVVLDLTNWEKQRIPFRSRKTLGYPKQLTSLWLSTFNKVLSQFWPNPGWGRTTNQMTRLPYSPSQLTSLRPMNGSLNSSRREFSKTRSTFWRSSRAHSGELMTSERCLWRVPANWGLRCPMHKVYLKKTGNWSTSKCS